MSSPEFSPTSPSQPAASAEGGSSTTARVMSVVPRQEEGARWSFRRKLYTLHCGAWLPHRLTDARETAQVLESLDLELQLSPLRDALRSKMWNALGNGSEDRPDATPAERVISCRVNLASGEFSGWHAGSRFQDASRHSPAELADAVGDASLVEHLGTHFLPVLREMFAALLPVEAQNQAPALPIHARKGAALLPYGDVFDRSLTLRRIHDGKQFILDDLYCVNPQCSCTDVTCVVLLLGKDNEPASAWAGFRYNIETQRFKPMPEMPAKLNAAEWFKQFSKESPIALELLLPQRFRQMRRLYATRR